ncbi:MAG TPA: M10 family metallopeptidase C-terminal domain-containing protein [Allosphingosinicella sp.]|nr:M10 family metallopeptidase C-terminal domain-containing protein [Allosphingosinicella sp.]
MAEEFFTAAAAGDGAPIVDLNGEAPGTSTAVDYQESSADVALAPEATVFDPDSRDFFGGSLTVAVASGGGGGDRLRVTPGLFTEEEGTLFYQNMAVGSVSGGSGGEALVIRFDRDDVFDASQQQISRRVDQEIAQALVRAIGYFNVSEAPVAGTRSVTFTLANGDGGTSAPATSEVTVEAVDDPAVAEDDRFTASESLVLEGNLFGDNGNGPDGDPDGTPIAVTEVNGDPDAVGRQITLESGARLTVFSDGRFLYDPRGAFDLAGSGSGAANSAATDGFSYAITGGDTADVAIEVAGDAGPGDTLRGDESDNEIVGTPERDVFRLEQGGNDRAFGLGGNDSFYFGAAYTSGDLVDGGAGFDVLILQGDYGAGATFGSFAGGNIPRIESISLFSGSNTSYGDDGGNSYSYNLTLSDRNVAAGATLRINGFGLGADENLIVNGAAETDGSFLIFAGGGTDRLTGGAGKDVFVFGHDGRFGAADTVDGGGGFDVVYLRGDYQIDFTGATLGDAAIASTPGALANIESIGLLSASDRTFAGGGDGEFDYWIVLADAMTADTGRLTVNGSGLGAAETMVVDGSNEAGGSLRLFAGAGDDTLTGGGGADLLYGGLGADTLTGNGGADVFRYQAAAESAPDAPDTIVAFLSGTDKVDLGRIDTDAEAEGDQGFRFIGEEAFSGRGAELRLTYNEELARWEAEGDLNGDRIADLLILFTDTETMTGSDFLL